jgi:hypothetical protein
MIEPRTDAELVDAVKQDCPQAFAEICRRFENLLSIKTYGYHPKEEEYTKRTLLLHRACLKWDSKQGEFLNFASKCLKNGISDEMKGQRVRERGRISQSHPDVQNLYSTIDFSMAEMDEDEKRLAELILSNCDDKKSGLSKVLRKYKGDFEDIFATFNGLCRKLKAENF